MLRSVNTDQTAIHAKEHLPDHFEDDLLENGSDDQPGHALFDHSNMSFDASTYFTHDQSLLQDDRVVGENEPLTTEFSRLDKFYRSLSLKIADTRNG